VAFDLVEEAVDTAHGVGGVASGLAAGALTFFVGDAIIDRMGGDKRKSSGGEQAAGSGLAIVLGAVLDGIPESIVLGIGLLAGAGVSVAFIVAVFVSNLPEGIAATTGLKASGWAPRRVIGLWLLVALVSALASLAGFGLFDDASNWTIAFVLAFAGGAVLTMLADTMMPEAFEHGGRQVGLMTTAGFAIAFALHLIE
jgi:ZIP family zinc transporter